VRRTIRNDPDSPSADARRSGRRGLSHSPGATTKKVAAGLVISLVLTLAACGGSASDAPSPLGQGHQGLEAGTHVLDLVALDERSKGQRAKLPRIELTLPAGWFNYDGWTVSKGEKVPFRMAVSFWDVDQVYPTPCDWAGKAMVDPGSEVDGLAAALANQPLRNAIGPTDVVLAGFHGKYVELSVPADIDFDDCDERYFESWTGKGWASDRYQQSPGQVDRIWVLDVAGERLVVDASYLPEATAQNRAELERVVDSIRFLD
jgi:hypothetical protein